MYSIILSCGCGDTDKFAKDAFKILFPKSPLPPIAHVLGSDANDRVKQIASALRKGEKKYAYLFRWDDTVTEAWDLLKGKRVL